MNRICSKRRTALVPGWWPETWSFSSSIDSSISICPRPMTITPLQWLDGLILITDSERACFVSFSQVDPLLRRLRQRPKGPEVAEKLCMSLLDCHGKGGAKPVLVFQGDGSFWLGMIGPSGNNPHRHHAIAHLHRCLALEG